MEIGLLPEDSFREETKSLDDAAGRDIDMASDARAFEDRAAPVRLGMTIGAAAAQGAVLATDRSEDLRPAPDPIRQRERPSTEKARAIADCDDLSCPGFDREAAFLSNLGLSPNYDRSPGGNKPAAWEKLRVIADSDDPILLDLKDDARPEHRSLSKLNAR
jgi:hypothetical protein